MNLSKRMLANTALIFIISVFIHCSSAYSDSKTVVQYDYDLHEREAASLRETTSSILVPTDLFSISEMSECDVLRINWQALPFTAKENQLNHFKGYRVLSVTKLHCTDSDFIRVTLFRGPYYFDVFYNLSGIVKHIQPIRSKS